MDKREGVAAIPSITTTIMAITRPGAAASVAADAASMPLSLQLPVAAPAA